MCDSEKELLTAMKLPIAKYRISFSVVKPFKISFMAGSSIRGSFGNTLRKIACMTHLKDCNSCPLHDSCPYTCIFVPPVPEKETIQKFSNIPLGYLLEVPVENEHVYEIGEKFSFNIVLFGYTINHLSLIVFALIKSMQNNIAHGKAVFSTLEHYDSEGNTTVIYQQGDSKISDHDKYLVLPEGANTVSSVRLKFLTPLRLQKDGKICKPETMTARDFLMPLFRRIGLLFEFYTEIHLNLDYGKLGEEFEKIEIFTSMQWKDYFRFSSRQNKKMNIGGYIGELELKNISPIVRQFLDLGMYTHVGKNVTFGLGQFSIIE